MLARFTMCLVLCLPAALLGCSGDNMMAQGAPISGASATIPSGLVGSGAMPDTNSAPPNPANPASNPALGSPAAPTAPTAPGAVGTMTPTAPASSGIGPGMAPAPAPTAPSDPGLAAPTPAGGTGGGMATAGGGAAAGPPPSMVADTPAGPDDGDPSSPVVSVPGVACGPNPSLFGLTATNITIGGRDVHLSYPCNKHRGAPVTFILNLHGTMPSEELKLYQVAYFSANAHVNTHNFIIASPKSVVSQWGNGDNGVDEPHLREVIDWVYTTFADFDIRSMWVGGHSWGAMYTPMFACKPEFEDKVDGLILMSTFPMLPACANRVSVINTNAEMDIAGPLPQGNLPMTHGCGAPEMHMLGNNEQTLWPNCDPGYVHSNYLMFGKAHADYMDPEVVKSIADLIKSARQ